MNNIKPVFIPRKIKHNKYTIKMYLGTELIGKVEAEVSDRLDFGVAFHRLNKKYWIINSIEIEERFRGRGLGSQLLNYSADFLKSKSRFSIALIPPLNEWTARLTSWYLRNGFECKQQYFVR